MLLCGGMGKLEGLIQGYYVKLIIFIDVINDMIIVREEIFGLVLVIIGYWDDFDVVVIVNDSFYGLSGYVLGVDIDRVCCVVSQMCIGMVYLNGVQFDLYVFFGGYKQLGNGWEWGEYGLQDFLEIKLVLGWYKL